MKICFKCKKKQPINQFMPLSWYGDNVTADECGSCALRSLPEIRKLMQKFIDECDETLKDKS